MKPVDVRLCTADPVAPNDLPRMAVVRICDRLPSMKNETEDGARRFYRFEADKIMEALAELPGGTMDQLLLLMLERRAGIRRDRAG